MSQLNDNLSIIRQYFNKYFPNIDLLILSSDGSLCTIELYDKLLCFYTNCVDSSAEKSFTVTNNDLFFCNNNLSYMIFRVLFHRITSHQKITSYDMIWLHSITDDQLARWMNLILITSEDNEFLRYRKNGNIDYLRSVLYADSLLCV